MREDIRKNNIYRHFDEVFRTGTSNGLKESLLLMKEDKGAINKLELPYRYYYLYNFPILINYLDEVNPYDIIISCSNISYLNIFEKFRKYLTKEQLSFCYKLNGNLVITKKEDMYEYFDDIFSLYINMIYIDGYKLGINIFFKEVDPLYFLASDIFNKEEILYIIKNSNETLRSSVFYDYFYILKNKYNISYEEFKMLKLPINDSIISVILSYINDDTIDDILEMYPDVYIYLNYKYKTIEREERIIKNNIYLLGKYSNFINKENIIKLLDSDVSLKYPILLDNYFSEEEIKYLIDKYNLHKPLNYNRGCLFKYKESYLNILLSKFNTNPKYINIILDYINIIKVSDDIIDIIKNRILGLSKESMWYWNGIFSGNRVIDDILIDKKLNIR